MKRILVFLILGVLLLLTGSIFYASESASVDFTDPMAYVICAGILCVVIGVVLFLERGRKKKTDAHSDMRRLAIASLMTALCYIGFQLFRIDIPVGPDGKTAVHLGNAFVVLGALFLGSGLSGLPGAIGLTLADLTSGYVTSMPKTFLIKFVIGALAGFLADRVFKLSMPLTRRARLRRSAGAAGIALAANVVLDPLLGYLYKRYLFGIPQDAAAALAKIGAFATLVNAGISFLLVMLVYNAVYPVLEQNRLL